MVFTKKRKSSKRYSRKKSSKLAPSTARAVKRIVKSQMKQVIETKNIDNSFEPIPLLALYHNVPYILETDCLFSTQGITDSEVLTSNRIGDSLYCTNIWMKLMLTSFSTRPNVLYRISVLKVKNGIVAGALNNPYGHPQCGNVLVAPINLENANIISVVYDRVFNSGPSGDYVVSGTGGDKKVMWNHNVKVNRKIKYDNGQSFAANPSYRVYLTAYDTQGAFITDNIARFTWFRRTHFMDA